MTTAIADGSVVTMHYTLTAPDGTVLDSSEGRDPLAYLHGANNIVPGLEKQLTGKAKGDKLQADVPAAEGYGERRGPEPVAVPKANFPQDAPLEPGMQFFAESANGPLPIWIVEVRDSEVVVDGNHPLAGVDLSFAIEVVDVREATADEKAHGHVHGPGGHAH